jgi:hypothetical protein
VRALTELAKCSKLQLSQNNNKANLPMANKPSIFLIASFLASLYATSLVAEVSRLEITKRETLAGSGAQTSYDSITGVVHFALDPSDAANQAIIDIAYAPINSDGLVEFSTDFRILVPQGAIANGTLLYNVNNRGGSRFPPEISPDHPLSKMGFTYLATGWINEISPRKGRLRLHAPIVSELSAPIVGQVRYEVIVGAATDEVNIAGAGHLAYRPTEAGLNAALLTRRQYQNEARVPIDRSQFELKVMEDDTSTQPRVNLVLKGGFQLGTIYELLYEAQDPVLAGSGMAGIRDLVSLIRQQPASAGKLKALSLPAIEYTVAWGNSQSGRLLRQFVYDGFNTDLSGDKVFDGVIPVIAGSGYGMFNNRFAMPTRTNGQHSNHLFPNDLFPFTYGLSRDPFTGRTDSILGKSLSLGTAPKIMHIQTSNEYWVRGGSLPHTNPQGTEDAEIPDDVRFYTIGGSQHGSGNGIPRAATNGQLPPNPNMWSPFSYSMIVAMHKWVSQGIKPPASRYPKIADNSLVASHENGAINKAAWRHLIGVNHPEAIYMPAYVNYGALWQTQRIVSEHPKVSESLYRALVPAVNDDNNDFSTSTILPPMTQVPIATFVSWNLRSFASGSEKSLARLSGGYIPFAANSLNANQMEDSRSTIAGLYDSYEDYLIQYEVATDGLISERYLLPEFKETIMSIARSNEEVFAQ